MKLLLFAIVISLFAACSKHSTLNPAPAPDPTKLQVTVADENRMVVPGAVIKLYRTANDYLAGTNAVGTQTTDAAGKALFSSLEPIKYYIDVQAGCKTNAAIGTQLDNTLVQYVTNYVTVGVQSSGTLRFTNTSASPYQVYINGVLKISNLPGGSVQELKYMPAQPYVIRTLQLSGYAVYATDKTYTGTLTCGGILTTTIQ